MFGIIIFSLKFSIKQNKLIVHYKK